MRRRSSLGGLKAFGLAIGVALAGSVLSGAVLVGCEGPAQPGRISEPSPQGPEESRSVVVLPADWPAEVPLYPGATLGGTRSLGRGWTLTLESPDSADEVVAFYRAKLARFEERASMNVGGKATYNWVDRERPMQVALSVAEEDRNENTSVTLAVTSDRLQREPAAARAVTRLAP
jgi:hypothetical protein